MENNNSKKNLSNNATDGIEYFYKIVRYVKIYSSVMKLH